MHSLSSHGFVRAVAGVQLLCKRVSSGFPSAPLPSKLFVHTQGKLAVFFGVLLRVIRCDWHILKSHVAMPSMVLS